MSKSPLSINSIKTESAGIVMIFDALMKTQAKEQSNSIFYHKYRDKKKHTCMAKIQQMFDLIKKAIQNRAFPAGELRAQW